MSILRLLRTVQRFFKLRNFKSLIRAGELQKIERTRDQVKEIDVLNLADFYWKLEEVYQKEALIYLIQDYVERADKVKDLALDFLQIPDEELTDISSKAIALLIIDDKYNKFVKYINDYALLQKDIDDCLIKYGKYSLKSKALISNLNETNIPYDAFMGSSGQRLYNAAYWGSFIECKKALLDGANINLIAEDGTLKGCTPLMVALLRENFDVAEYLIRTGADLTVKRRHQHALWWAGARGNIKIVDLILKRIKTDQNYQFLLDSAFVEAANLGRVEIVELLHNHGADIHAEIEDGRTGYFLAASKGFTEIVKFFLNNGAQVDKLSVSGKSLLMYAAEGPFYDMAELIIRKGADVNAKNQGAQDKDKLEANFADDSKHIAVNIAEVQKGFTPLIYAVSSGNEDLIRLLIDYGADVDYKIGTENVKQAGKGVMDFARNDKVREFVKALRGQLNS